MPAAQSARGHLLDVDQRGLVAGDVPDLGVDRSGHDQLHIDSAPRDVEVHRFRESAHRVLGRVVGRLVRDRDATAHARDPHDRARLPFEHLRQQRERHAYRGVEVDVHRLVDVLERYPRHVHALRDRRVVHDRVKPAERIPGVECQLFGRVEIGEVDRPHARLGRVSCWQRSSTSSRRFGPACDDADGRAPLGEDRRERGADTRRRAGEEDLRAFQFHRLSFASDTAFSRDSCSAHE